MKKSLIQKLTLFALVCLNSAGLMAQTPLPSSEEIRAPSDNPSTPAKIELGRLLFWDPVLSGDGDVACATCHHPDFGYAENLDISIGVNGLGLGSDRHFNRDNEIPFVMRNSQSVLNTAFNGIDDSGNYDPEASPMFWDLRANSLEEQALLPILTFEEMRGLNYQEEEILGVVVSRLQEIPQYQDMFDEAFGDNQGSSSSITSENLAKALAAFQRTLTASNSPYDRYIAGDTSAMTSQQIEGMQAFEQVGCAECHSGPMFSDFALHVLGVPDNDKLPESDQGLNQSYAFRTPTLRNLEFTAPYMHSGVFSSLREVLRFYDGGRRAERNPAVGRNDRDILFRRLDDVDDHDREIIAFLEALNDDNFDKSIPTQVPSGLAVGGLIN